MDLLNLVAKVTLDKSEYEQGLSDMDKDVGKRQSNLKKGVLHVAEAGIAAIGAFAVASVKTGAEFDKSMSQVAATMGVTVDEIGTLRDFAMQMGATTVFSATQASEALNYMALAGYDAEKSMKMLPTVLDLAAAGNMDLARASDMVTDAESALSLTTEEAAAMVDQMAKTASKSNTSVEQLGDAMLTIGGTATLMSGGTDRLATVLGILADNGIKGSEAGTHLRNMLLKLSAPTKEGYEAMEELGLSVFDAQGNMRDMQDIIGDLGNALSGLTDEEKIKYISTLFNARDVAAVNALLNTTTERWNELGDAIVNSEGAAKAMAETQLDNLAGDVTLLKSAMEGLQISLSDKLTPVFRGAVQLATKLIGKFDEMIPVISEAVAPVLERIAEIWNSRVKPVVMEIIGFFASQLGPTFQAVGHLISSVWQNIIRPALDAMHPLFVLIGQVIQSVWEGVIKPTWTAIVDNINILADGLNGFWDGVVKPIWDKLVELFNEVKPQLDQVVNAAKGFLSSIKSIFTSIYNAIKDPINKARDAVKAAIDKMKSFFNFTWELPKLKMPHLTISGRFSISPPSVPKFSIAWYKKAYDSPFLFTKPTVFPGFGDGGGSGEFVYGRDNLLNDIREASGNSETVSILEGISSQIAEIVTKMQFNVVLDDGTLVGRLAPKIDNALNDVSNMRGRGVSLA